MEVWTLDWRTSVRWCLFCSSGVAVVWWEWAAAAGWCLAEVTGKCFWAGLLSIWVVSWAEIFSSLGQPRPETELTY